MEDKPSRQNTLSPVALDTLNKLFDSIDTDHSKTISVDEFRHACHKLSLPVTDETVKDFLKSSTNGLVTFDQFCKYYLQRLGQVFSYFDLDKSGEISAAELGAVFQKLGVTLSERELHVIISQADKDANGEVNFTEFCEFFATLPSPDVQSVVKLWSSGASVDIGTDLAPAPLPPASVPIWRAFVAGGFGGVVSRTATAPLEKVKILQQTATGKQLSITRHLTGVWQKEGLKSLFAGNGANCIRVLPFSALVCVAYSNMAKHFPLDHTSSPWNPLWRMGAGATAGTFATLLTHPIDVVRARLTIQSQATLQYRGLVHGVASVARAEGMSGLYSGLGPTLIAIAPFMAVQQVSYDILKQKALDSKVFSPSATLFLVCGSAAGALAQTVVYPLDVIRRRMQVQSLKLKAAGQAGTGKGQTLSLFKFFKGLHLRNLFPGLTATYLKVMPSAAISLLVRDAVLGRL